MYCNEIILNGTVDQFFGIGMCADILDYNISRSTESIIHVDSRDITLCLNAVCNTRYFITEHSTTGRAYIR